MEDLLYNKRGNFDVAYAQNDWRLMGQEKYLMNARLRKQTYVAPTLKWDHDHCEFCTVTFSEYDGDLHEGYSTPANKCWICEQCFQDFKKMFHFAVASEA